MQAGGGEDQAGGAGGLGALGGLVPGEGSTELLLAPAPEQCQERRPQPFGHPEPFATLSHREGDKSHPSAVQKAPAVH